MKRIISFLMKMKIDDLIEDLEENKEESLRIQAELDKIVRPQTVAAKEYRRYVKEELENTWRRNKLKMKSKVDHLKAKNSKRVHDNCKIEVPKSCKGVKISDYLFCLLVIAINMKGGVT